MFPPINLYRKYKLRNKGKEALTTFFLLTGKLPLDLTIIVHNLTSSG